MFYIKKQIPIFQVIGAIILFGSWVSQNYMLSKLDEEWTYLMTANSKVDSAKMHYDLWYGNFLNELLSEKPNEKLLLELEYRTAYQLSNFVEPSIARISNQGDYEYSISVLEKLRSLLKEGKAEKNRNKIEKALVLLTSAYNKMHDELIRNINLRVQKVKEKRNFWASCFLGLYCLGTILIGFGSAKTWIGWKHR